MPLKLGRARHSTARLDWVWPLFTIIRRQFRIKLMVNMLWDGNDGRVVTVMFAIVRSMIV